MTDTDVLITRTGGLTTITLNRPETLNALQRPMLEQLRDAVLDAGADNDCRAVVLTGSGRAFCAGADLKSFGVDLENPADRHLNYKTPTLLHDVLGLIMRLEKPVLGAINGPAVGAGFPVAAACDILVASDAAYFALGYLAIGLSPDGSSTFRLPRSIGAHKFLELLYLQDRLTPAQAMELGLVARVLPAGEFDQGVADIAACLTALPTIAAGIGKNLVLRSFDNSLETHLQLETDGVIRSGGTDDFRAGVHAFVEKRKPVFSGR